MLEKACSRRNVVENWARSGCDSAVSETSTITMKSSCARKGQSRAEDRQAGPCPTVARGAIPRASGGGCYATAEAKCAKPNG